MPWGTQKEATEEYTASIPEKTNAGTYYVWYKVKGDRNHYDTESAAVTVTISSAEYVPEVYRYIITLIQGGKHTIGDGRDAVIKVERSPGNEDAFRHFRSVTMDGTSIASPNYTAVSGSVILTLKSAYLDTLSAGPHTLGLIFDDY